MAHLSPLRHGLRRATSPYGRGKVLRFSGSFYLAPPSGELVRLGLVGTRPWELAGPCLRKARLRFTGGSSSPHRNFVPAGTPAMLSQTRQLQQYLEAHQLLEEL